MKDLGGFHKPLQRNRFQSSLGEIALQLHSKNGQAAPTEASCNDVFARIPNIRERPSYFTGGVGNEGDGDGTGIKPSFRDAHIAVVAGDLFAQVTQKQTLPCFNDLVLLLRAPAIRKPKYPSSVEGPNAP